jgi:hypothetical protein
VHLAGQHAQPRAIVGRDGDQHVVGQHAGVEELEGAVLGGFDGSDVAGQAGQCRPKVLSGFAKNPPVVPVSGAVVLVTFRLHPLHHPLEHGREAHAHLVGVQAEQVDDQHVAGRRHQVAAIAVLTDVALQPRHGAQAERGGFFAADDESPRRAAGHAGGRQLGVGLQTAGTADCGAHGFRSA